MTADNWIGRKRDRWLVDALIRHAAANGGKITPEVAAAALKDVWCRGGKPMGPQAAMEVVRSKLKNPNIRAAIADIYEEIGGFTIGDAVNKHVEHIEAGSYPALKDYLTMTLPMPAKKVEVGMTVASIGASMLNSVPAVAARALGPATVEDAKPEAQTVEFHETEDQGEDDS